MVLSIIFIAVLSYALCLPDVCALVSAYGFQEDHQRPGAADYADLRKRFGMLGVCYALLIDLVRALIGVLVGSVLLKSAGYPEIGRHLVLFFTLFFMLAGRAFPVLSVPKPTRSIAYPAFLLAFADWRVFLVCAALCLVLDLLTGLRGLTVLAATILFPLFSLVFRSGSLVSFLMLISGLCLLFAYLDVLFSSLRLLPRRLHEIPQRLRSLVKGLRARLAETARRLDEESDRHDDDTQDP